MTLITFEGIDGSGKTTQSKLLADYLTAKGHSVVLTREPNNPKIRETILNGSKLPDEVVLMLFTLDRVLHIRDVIRPALEAGKILICDRYTLSTMAYQAYGLGLSRDVVEYWIEQATEGLKPDITFWLDVNPTEAYRELSEGDTFESKGLEFQWRFYNGFVKEWGKGTCTLTDRLYNVKTRGLSKNSIAVDIRKALNEQIKISRKST